MGDEIKLTRFLFKMNATASPSWSSIALGAEATLQRGPLLLKLEAGYGGDNFEGSKVGTRRISFASHGVQSTALVGLGTYRHNAFENIPFVSFAVGVMGRAGAALKIEGDYAAGLANDESTRFVGSAAGLYAMSQSLFGLSAGGMTGALAFETILPIAHSLPSGAKADSRLGVGFSVYMGGTF